ncbi:MAG: hypothetical protein A2V65_09230 [Deltaproteobacteria bacterium RBG_13_49_15]|nr:MAG: hypothetical protein A2V65_09230 [Deltaproteobacteria bacterium RBG_13_49_15]
MLTPASSGTTHFITEPLTINWTSTADIGNVRIKLMRDGSEFETLASNEPRTGSFLWRIGYSDSTLGSSACSDAALIGALGGGAARRFQIRIESRSHPEIFGEGPEFNISMPTITVTQPSGNPRIGCGGTLGIVWESSGLWGDINLEAWRPGGGGPYHVIQENIDRFLGHYDWRVWGCPSVWEGSLDEPYNIDLKIRVRSTSCHDVYGESTGTFRVTD